MKGFRKLLALVLAATALVGIGAPLQTKAAVKPKVKTVTFDEYDPDNSNYAFLAVKTTGSGSTWQYQYKVYVNGKLKTQGFSICYNEGTSKRFCRVELPPYSACTVKIKALRGKNRKTALWSKWSKYVAIVPKVNVTSATYTESYMNLKWKKMKGATDYAVYTKKESSGKWNKIKVVKGTSAKIDIRSYPLNASYNVRVIARKKVNGKYTGSKTWTQFVCHR